MNIQMQYSDLPENVNFATKGDLMRKFLSENGVAVHASAAREALSAADVADKIRQSMVLVECDL